MTHTNLDEIVNTYDLIIVGGGVAGLSLTYHLIRSPLRDHSILIVEKDAKDCNDRTLSFWADQPTLFDNIVYRSWSQLQFVGDNARVVDLGTWRYKMIRGIDFCRFVRRKLLAHPSVDCLHGTVGEIEDGVDYARVSVDSQIYAGKWIFDSRFSLSRFRPESARYHYLQQHFKGWVIGTPEIAFDPQVATAFDFRPVQKKGARFFYVLPFSERQVLVEYVLLGGGADRCDQALAVYLETSLGIRDYHVLSEEEGIIPVTDQPFLQRLGRRIMAIGTLGGRVKPSSGYAFTRIQLTYNAPVKQILVDGSRATGVVLKDGSQLSADVIVANAGLPYVYRQLLPDKAESDRLERMDYTCSAIMFYWGVDKVYPQLEHHNLFLSGDYRGSFDSIFGDYSLPDDPGGYVHAPCRTDPSAAPPGQDTLMILVPSGRLDDAVEQDWEVLQSRARSAVLNRLADVGVTDLEEHIKFEVSYTPRTWLTKFNLTRGASLGSLSHNVAQIGYMRPPNRHRRYGNLYFVGSSTHPGSGLPLVLLSAQLTTERILNEIGVPEVRRVVTSSSLAVTAQIDAE